MMRAMVLEKAQKPFVLKHVPIPCPKEGQVLLKVEACGLCKTDSHIFEGELAEAKLPLIQGHQIVGMVQTNGKFLKKGDRVGIPWLAKSCGSCFYCQREEENLCDEALFTGYTVDGGFAEYTLAYEKFALPLKDNHFTPKMAPLLCAGLIGYRALKMCGDAQKIGFYGFGSAAYLLLQVVLSQHKRVFVFTRQGDKNRQKIAKEMGASWVGDSDITAPQALDACILFAPVGSLVVNALTSVRKGGKVICAEIHMSDIPSFPYKILWGERSISSVANLTRQDGKEFLTLVNQVPLQTEVTFYPLEQLNEALQLVKEGKISSSVVILPSYTSQF